MSDAPAKRERLALAATAVAGAGLGLLVAAAAAGRAAAGVAAAKPYVTGAMIGFLLGALIAIAAILVWRETLVVGAGIRRRARRGARPVVLRPHRPGFAPRARHH